MTFQIEPAIFERFPRLLLGVLLLNNVNNTSPSEELEHLLIAAQEKVGQELSGITLSEHPQVAPWREAYRAFGVKAKDYPSSIENLLKRVLKSETLRRINPLVDLYNVVSLEHLIPVGGEDLDCLQGDIVLRFAGQEEPAIHLLGDAEAKAPKAGEVIYADNIGAICRRFNWKEAERSKLTANTKRAVLVVEALPPVNEAKLQAALNQLSTLAERFCHASVTTHILSPASPTLTLNH
jgi:DNA/RNA-binding domain of Phe-tRNA-synthetase-like protein